MSDHAKTRGSTVLPVSLAAALLAAPPVDAAVRYCRPMLVGPERTAATESDGKRLALEGWSAAARAFGVEYAAWRMANTKTLSCRRGVGSGADNGGKDQAGKNAATGQFICQARGAPCGISQVPGQVPGPPRRSPTPATVPGGKPLQI